MPDEAQAQLPEPVADGGDKEQAPDPNAELTAKLDAFRATWDTQLTELKQNVGRIQSVADKASNREPDAALQAELTGTQALLDGLLEGLDPDALPVEVRTKLLTARAAVAAQAQRTEMKKELAAELREELAPAVAPVNPAANANTVLEQKLVETIKAAGLDPDDPKFNWQEYANLLRANPTTGAVEVTLAVASTIADNSVSAEDKARDDKKANASSAPAGGSAAPAADDLSAVLNDPNLDLDAKKDALMKAIR